MAALDDIPAQTGSEDGSKAAQRRPRGGPEAKMTEPIMLYSTLSAVESLEVLVSETGAAASELGAPVVARGCDGVTASALVGTPTSPSALLSASVELPEHPESATTVMARAVLLYGFGMLAPNRKGRSLRSPSLYRIILRASI